MQDKTFFGTVLALFALTVGHPWIALFIFWLSII